MGTDRNCATLFRGASRKEEDSWLLKGAATHSMHVPSFQGLDHLLETSHHHRQLGYLP